MVRPERVLEAGVRRSGVDEECESELSYISEALKHIRVNEL